MWWNLELTQAKVIGYSGRVGSGVDVDHHGVLGTVGVLKVELRRQEKLNSGEGPRNSHVQVALLRDVVFLKEGAQGCVVLPHLKALISLQKIVQLNKMQSI